MRALTCRPARGAEHQAAGISSVCDNRPFDVCDRLTRISQGWVALCRHVVQSRRRHQPRLPVSSRSRRSAAPGSSGLRPCRRCGRRRGAPSQVQALLTPAPLPGAGQPAFPAGVPGCAIRRRPRCRRRPMPCGQGSLRGMVMADCEGSRQALRAGAAMAGRLLTADPMACRVHGLLPCISRAGTPRILHRRQAAACLLRRHHPRPRLRHHGRPAGHATP